MARRGHHLTEVALLASAPGDLAAAGAGEREGSGVAGRPRRAPLAWAPRARPRRSQRRAVCAGAHSDRRRRRGHGEARAGVRRGQDLCRGVDPARRRGCRGGGGGGRGGGHGRRVASALLARWRSTAQAEYISCKDTET